MVRQIVLFLALFTMPHLAMAQKATEGKSTKASPAAPAEKPAAKRQSVHDQFAGSGYGVAGCGLGSILFGAKPGMVQVPSATTNGLWGNQTFGISSGTSNCDIPESGFQAAKFIEINKETLKKEAARGNGETLLGLNSILGCSNQKAFNQKIQKNFSSIFSSDNAYDNAREILQTISESSPQQSCRS